MMKLAFLISFRTYKKIGLGGIDSIYLAQNRDQWKSLMNTVMNIWFNKMQASS
jgi:hypothetical protein